MYDEGDLSSPFSQPENSFDEFSGDDEMDWEQVDVAQETPLHWQTESANTEITPNITPREGPSKPLEITLDSHEVVPKASK